MPNNIRLALNEFSKGIRALIGDKLDSIILYGSYARGEQDKNGEPSDIDIMVLVNSPENELKEIQKKVLDYSFDLNIKYNILISPIVENVDVYNHRRGFMAFYKNVQKDGVLING